MFDLINEIAQTLSNNKLRTALTGFAVAWGIFMLIVLLAMANGVQNAFTFNFMGSSSQTMEVWGGRTSQPYHGYKEGRRINLKAGDMPTLADEHSDFIDNVTSSISGGWAQISTTTTFTRDNYQGVYPNKVLAGGNKLLWGRNLNDRDMSRRAKVAVMAKPTAEQLFPPDGAGAVGQRVKMAGLSFQVVGVYDTRWRRGVYIPFTTARMMAEDKENLGSLTIDLKGMQSEEDGKNAESQVKSTLAAVHDFNPNDDSAVWIANRYTESLRGLQAMDILTMGVWVLGILTLLTGIVGISNIMFVSVRERTHEIGIRRAIGARPRSILVQVIAEAVAITTLFGYIGIVAGMFAVEFISQIIGETDFVRNPSVSVSIAIEVTVLLILAGALAGLFPALRALKVKPVEALRDE